MKPYYQDDLVTIWHGDNRELAPALGSFNLVLTDPPYNHEHLDGAGFSGGEKFYREGALDGLNDFDLSQYSEMLLGAADMMVAFCSRDGIVEYANLAAKSERKFDLHVWHKTNAIPFCKNTWKSDVEYIALVWSKKPGWVQMEQHMHSKVYTSSLCRDPLHPAAKPLELLKKYLSILDPKTVFDPFAGSGTVGRAAKDLGKKAVLIEQDERHCETAALRCSQETLGI